jgi:hypothetical protein
MGGRAVPAGAYRGVQRGAGARLPSQASREYSNRLNSLRACRGRAVKVWRPGARGAGKQHGSTPAAQGIAPLWRRERRRRAAPRRRRARRGRRRAGSALSARGGPLPGAWGPRVAPRPRLRPTPACCSPRRASAASAAGGGGSGGGRGHALARQWELRRRAPSRPCPRPHPPHQATPALSRASSARLFARPRSGGASGGASGPASRPASASAVSRHANSGERAPTEPATARAAPEGTWAALKASLASGGVSPSCGRQRPGGGAVVAEALHDAGDPGCSGNDARAGVHGSIIGGGAGHPRSSSAGAHGLGPPSPPQLGRPLAVAAGEVAGSGGAKGPPWGDNPTQQQGSCWARGGAAAALAAALGVAATGEVGFVPGAVATAAALRGGAGGGRKASLAAGSPAPQDAAPASAVPTTAWPGSVGTAGAALTEPRPSSAAAAAAAVPAGARRGSTAAFLGTTRAQAGLAAAWRAGPGVAAAAVATAGAGGGGGPGGPGCYGHLSFSQVDPALRRGPVMRPPGAPASEAAAARRASAAAAAAAAAAERRAAARAARRGRAEGSGGSGAAAALRQMLETPRDAAEGGGGAAAASPVARMLAAAARLGVPVAQRTGCAAAAACSREGHELAEEGAAGTSATWQRQGLQLTGCRPGASQEGAPTCGGRPSYRSSSGAGGWGGGGASAGCAVRVSLLAADGPPTIAGGWSLAGGSQRGQGQPLDPENWGAWGFAAPGGGGGAGGGGRSRASTAAVGCGGRRAGTAPAAAARGALPSRGAAAASRPNSRASAAKAAAAAGRPASAQRQSSGGGRVGPPWPWSSDGISGGGGGDVGDGAALADQGASSCGGAPLPSAPHPASAAALAAVRARWAGNLLRLEDKGALCVTGDATSPAWARPATAPAPQQQQQWQQQQQEEGKQQQQQAAHAEGQRHHQQLEPALGAPQGGGREPLAEGAAPGAGQQGELQAVALAALAAAAAAAAAGGHGGGGRCASVPARTWRRGGGSGARLGSAGCEVQATCQGREPGWPWPEAGAPSSQQQQPRQAPAGRRRPLTCGTLCTVPSGAPLALSQSGRPCGAAPARGPAAAGAVPGGARPASTAAGGARPPPAFGGSLTRAQAAAGLRAMGAPRVVPPAPDVATPRRGHEPYWGGPGAASSAGARPDPDRSALGHVRRAPAARLPPNFAAQSRRWAREAARAAMEAL